MRGMHCNFLSQMKDDQHERMMGMCLVMSPKQRSYIALWERFRDGCCHDLKTNILKMWLLLRSTSTGQPIQHEMTHWSTWRCVCQTHEYVDVIIEQSTYFKLGVVSKFIRSMLHSVECNKLIRWLKSLSLWEPLHNRIPLPTLYLTLCLVHRTLFPFTKILRTFTPVTFTWGYVTAGTDPSAVCQVLCLTSWRGWPMTTTGPIGISSLSTIIVFCTKSFKSLSKQVDSHRVLDYKCNNILTVTVIIKLCLCIQNKKDKVCLPGKAQYKQRLKWLWNVLLSPQADGENHKERHKHGVLQLPGLCREQRWLLEDRGW